MAGGVSAFIDRHNERMLRIGFAIVFFWFGILKTFNLSPAEHLVNSTLGWLQLDFVPPVLGLWECIIGMSFLVPRWTKVTMVMFLMHMAGTMTPLFFLPKETFLAWPYQLSFEGQYVLKNFVFLGAGAMLWSSWKKKIETVRR
jgi:uncharacterized membrane protein YkgB